MTAKEAIVKAVEELAGRMSRRSGPLRRGIAPESSPAGRANGSGQRGGACQGLASAGGGRSVARFVKGDVVVLPFPFSDLSQSKRRPALVVAEAGGDELVLCQITSQPVRDRYAVGLNQADFRAGSLSKQSNVRPNRVFTADAGIIAYSAGHLHDPRTNEVVEKLVELLREQGH